MEQNEVTVQDMEQIAFKIKLKREECDAIAEEKKRHDGELLALEMQAISYLTILDKDSYKSDFGTLSLSTRTSYKLPKDWENKTALFNYLKEKGLYEEAVTVNSAWLNGFCKKEVAAAQENKDAFFSVPGIEYSAGTPILSFRKAK